MVEGLVAMWPPEKLAAQVVDVQRSMPFQFLPSLLRVRRGWFANHALPRKAVGASRLQSARLVTAVAGLGFRTGYSFSVFSAVITPLSRPPWSPPVQVPA
jgi:hypothetical protein